MMFGNVHDVWGEDSPRHGAQSLPPLLGGAEGSSQAQPHQIGGETAKARAPATVAPRGALSLHPHLDLDVDVSIEPQPRQPSPQPHGSKVDMHAVAGMLRDIRRHPLRQLRGQCDRLGSSIMVVGLIVIVAAVAALASTAMATARLSREMQRLQDLVLQQKV